MLILNFNVLYNFELLLIIIMEIKFGILI